MKSESINEAGNSENAGPWGSLSSPEAAQSIATERLVSLAQQRTEKEIKEGRMSQELIAAYGAIASQNAKLAQGAEDGRFRGVSAESWSDLASACDSAKAHNHDFLMFDSGKGDGVAYDCLNDDILAANNPDKLKARFEDNPNITDENFDEAQAAYHHIKDLHRFAVKYDDSRSLVDGSLDGVLGAPILDLKLRGAGYKLVGEGDDRHYESDAASLDEIKQGIKALEDKIEELKQARE